MQNMANTTSAQKATRKIERRTAVNKARNTRMKTEVRKVEEAIAAGDKNSAIAQLKSAEPVIAKTGQKGVVHKRTASRKISRLTKRVMSMA
jgi:small subunit ribosomal protein S20